MGPGVITEAFTIIAKIPSDVRESGEACDGVVNEPFLIIASSVGVNSTVVHIKHQGNVHVAVASELQHPVEFLPIRQIESGIVEPRVKWIVRILCPPACQPVGSGSVEKEMLSSS